MLYRKIPNYFTGLQCAGLNTLRVYTIRSPILRHGIDKLSSSKACAPFIQAVSTDVAARQEKKLRKARVLLIFPGSEDRSLSGGQGTLLQQKPTCHGMISLTLFC